MRTIRYSVSTLLLLTTFVAIAISSLVMARHLAQIRAERQEILEQTGYLDVPDPSKVYVRELYCPSPETWQFQIYTPPGHALKMGFGADLRQDEDFPKRLLFEQPYGTVGQTTVTISCYQNRAGIWRLATYFPRGGLDLRLTGDWMEDVSGDFSWVLKSDNRISIARGGEPIHGPVRVYDPSDRIPLWILRDKGSANSGSLMIYLEANLQSNFRAKTLGPSPDGTE